jgi:hypothetical protein
MFFLNKTIIYFPHLVLVTLIFFPNPYSYLSAGSFPAVSIAGFTIRVVEILFFATMAVYVMFAILKMILSKQASAKTSNDRKNLGKNVIIILLILFVVGLFRGILENSSRMLYDVRGVSVYMVIPIYVQIMCNRYNNNRIINSFRNIALLIVVLNFVNVFFGNIGFGGISNITMIIILYALSTISITILLKHKSHQTISRVYTIPIMAIILYSLSKWVIFTATTIILASIYLAYTQNVSKGIKSTVIITFGVLMLMGLLFNDSFMMSLLGDRYANVDDYIYSRWERGDVQDASGGRFELWEVMIESTKGSLIIGKGLGGDKALIEAIAYSRESRVYIGEHNVLIWLLLRFGLIGVFIFIYLFIKLIRDSIKMMAKMDKLSYQYYYLATNTVFIIGFLALNMVGLYFFVFEAALFFAFIISSQIALLKNEKSSYSVMN